MVDRTMKACMSAGTSRIVRNSLALFVLIAATCLVVALPAFAATDDDEVSFSTLSESEFAAIEEDTAETISLEVAAVTSSPAPILQFTLSQGSPINIAPKDISGTPYYFIPSGVTLSSVNISTANDGVSDHYTIVPVSNPHGEELVTGQAVNLFNYLLPADSHEWKFTLKTYDASNNCTGQYEYRLMQSDSTASVFLTSADPVNEGRDYIESDIWHELKAPGSVRVIGTDASERYSGDFSAIKGRGNTSWQGASKKSYQVKLNKKADLLDGVSSDTTSGKAKKWLLIANPFDPTLVRSEISYQLAREIGLQYAVDSEPVDLFYDGDYRGSYLLTDKVEIGEGRVEIFDLESEIEDANADVDLDTLPTVQSTTSYGAEMQYVQGVKDPADISGGYILELDGAYYWKEKSWFKTSGGLTFVSKSPEYLSQNQMLYISNFANEAFKCIDYFGYNPDTGLSLFDYFDKDSLVKYYYLQQFSKNTDQFYSSTYFYKPEGEDKLYAGPLWDVDGAYGIINGGDSLRTDHWYLRGGCANLVNCPEFMQTLKDMYSSQIKPYAQNLAMGNESTVGSFRYTIKKNEGTRSMNYKIWGVANSYHNHSILPTTAENITFMDNWIRERFTWLDAAIPAFSNTYPNNIITMHRAYNPNSGEHFYTASDVEIDSLVQAGWIYEGEGWKAPTFSQTPVYRLYSGTDHHYTTDYNEYVALISMGWIDEGIGWYSDDVHRMPLYRQFNPNVDPSAPTNNSGSHNYTTDINEHETLCSIGWHDEGIGWYGIN